MEVGTNVKSKKIYCEKVIHSSAKLITSFFVIWEVLGSNPIASCIFRQKHGIKLAFVRIFLLQRCPHEKMLLNILHFYQ
jgi:hypothetical protein